MSFFMETSIKTSVILLVALAATFLLRKRSAALRHWILATAVLCAAGLPVVSFVTPPWSVGLGMASASSAPMPANPTVASDISTEIASYVDQPAVSAAIRTVTIEQVALAVWLAGFGINALVLFVGFARLRWIASASQGVVAGSWIRLSHDIAREYGLQRSVLLLQTVRPNELVTWGFLRPKVLLPGNATEWSEDCARVVLSHELAHVKRGDWLLQVAAELLRCVHWFNPLVWVTCRRLRQDSELACDDIVLSRGIEGVEYAEHLLGLARTFLYSRRTCAPVQAMVRPSTLERRIHAMLNASSNRTPLTRLARIVTVAVLLAGVVPLAGLRAQTAFATFSGSVFDEIDGFVPNVTLVLSNVHTQAKHEVRSDPTGRFEFVGLPPGDYALEAKYPGFATLRGTLTLAGHDVRQDVRLEIGSLEETITVKDTNPSRSQEVFEQLQQVEREIETRRRQANSSTCTSSPLGGNIRAPRKLRHVRPVYPQQLSDAKMGGFVRLQGRIGTDGSFKELWVQQSADPALDQAALEAVREWKFSETLLNCVPVEVSMTINVTFEGQ